MSAAPGAVLSLARCWPGRVLLATSAALLLFASSVDPLASSADARSRATLRCDGEKADVRGTDGSDRIVLRGPERQVVAAGDGDDLVISRSGRDRVCGGPGNDTLLAGRGRDRVFGGAGQDTLDGGVGSDKLLGGGDADLILGGPGGEHLYGGAGADHLYGEQQDDHLYGESGNDVLVGSHGVDELFGGEDDDWLRGDTERDDYHGGPGEDWGSFATATDLHDASTSGFGISHYALHPFTTWTVSGDTGPGISDDLGDGVENIMGSAFRDVIRVPPQGRVNGGGGNDVCSFSLAGNHDCSGPATGRIPIVFVESFGPDPGVILAGGPEHDAWTISQESGLVRVASETPLTPGPGCAAAQDAPGEIECRWGSVPLGYIVAAAGRGSDAVTVSGPVDRTVVVKLDGGRDDDVLHGGPGGEILIPGADGSDVLLAGAGDDFLAARSGPDFLDGGPGADQLVTNTPCDGHVFRGGTGGPDIAGFAQTRNVAGIKATIGGEVTSLHPEYYAKTCVPSRIAPDNEVLEGTRYADLLIGSEHSDALILGGRGNDFILGRGGNDVLRGERGLDALYGGLGYDTLQARDLRGDRVLSCGRDGGRALADRYDPPTPGCD